MNDLEKMIDKKITPQGSELLTKIAKLITDSGYLCSPLVYGKLDTEVGFDAIDKADGRYLDRFTIMLNANPAAFIK